MHLVVGQVVQLEHVDEADRRKLLERLAGAAVEELGFAAVRQAAPRRARGGWSVRSAPSNTA